MVDNGIGTGHFQLLNRRPPPASDFQQKGKKTQTTELNFFLSRKFFRRKIKTLRRVVKIGADEVEKKNWGPSVY